MENKETIEEAAENYSIFWLESKEQLCVKDAFEAGAKWQAERMYSEEEVLDLLHRRSFHLTHKKDTKTTKEWFEQFKKK
jgi:hypothetical protein